VESKDYVGVESKYRIWCGKQGGFGIESEWDLVQKEDVDNGRTELK
jgi:hypothetical protein